MALPPLVMKIAWLVVKNPKTAAMATTAVLGAAAKLGAVVSRATKK